jgi:hypothetical protein
MLAACATDTSPQAAMIERASQAVSSAKQTSGDLKLTCAPEDSQVWLDGVPVGTCQDFAGRPKGLWLGAGMRKVEVKREGYMPFETYIEPDGTRARLTVTLAPSNLGGNP